MFATLIGLYSVSFHEHLFFFLYICSFRFLLHVYKVVGYNVSDLEAIRMTLIPLVVCFITVSFHRPTWAEHDEDGASKDKVKICRGSRKPAGS